MAILDGQNYFIMKSAYIYVRVSTDEQMRRGYSLIEQEARLLQYCKANNILVEDIYREDYSAKDFNRPEWKKLIKSLKRNKNRSTVTILVLKWDRFSRNILFAYQMLDLLKKLNINVEAIDQPIDFTVPESTVMLAIYLSIPEAENCRRSKNTSDGIRRARKLGRWPSKAPIGYLNTTDQDGKKIIVIKQPEADHIRWAFQQMSTGSYSIGKLNKIAWLNGFKCRKNNLWRILHNPIYCGLISLKANQDEGFQILRGIHEPLISEQLFNEVQTLLASRRRFRGKSYREKAEFPLRGFLDCPYCARKLSASISQGRHAKYRYYHCCTPRCKGRFRAETLEMSYETELKKFTLTPAALKLLKVVLEDENIFTLRKSLLANRTSLLYEVSTEEIFISKVRKHFVEDKIDHEDFLSLKKENKEKLKFLNERLLKIEEEIKRNEITLKESVNITCNLSISYKNLDIEGKRFLINLFSPSSIDKVSRNLNGLEVDPSLKPIIFQRKESAKIKSTHL